MAAAKKKVERPREVRNSKVGRSYFVGEKLEAGIKLTGTEVKSVRAGKAQINDSFVRVEKGDKPTLYHAHIDEYAFGNENNHNPTRPRLLLLHKKQIDRLKFELEAGGQALIPTRLYFKEGLIKIEIALCKGKKLFDKREDLKRKTQMREAERFVRGRHR
ncbi:SsrA-binding protein SmpB [Rubellicoccus peritrichatus]|uniref:SsrA-binding protein n=1 Tax=Rubellicoccus peritrichatus TaxID=3080537 RepID=A0AAQ3QU20_9BACT|nr:SsrA-binding protein SmpB [Puniceicoccus sp. CR14]WOO40008.1 SsrA-binding protein SmpB [Puniceicoccus sp. CR14]